MSATLINGFKEKHVWVVGDVMTDEYMEGEIERISPEAPVQVVKVTGGYSRPGGAANVAENIKSLGGQVTLFGERPKNPRKVRVMCKHQQMIRLDYETTEPISQDEAKAILKRMSELPKPDAIILSDYAKGVLTDYLTQTIVECFKGICPILVDPKGQDWRKYEGVDVFTPNQKEFREVDELPPGCFVVTQGERGMVVYDHEAETVIPSVAKQVYDVTGAGDTVIAVLALCMTSGLTLVESAKVANIAAGIVVGKVGTSTVTPEELAQVLPEPTDLLSKRQAWKLQGKTVVFTNGCFDLFHIGHLNLLHAAKKFGDVLVVGINSDESVRRLKGVGRPVIPQDERAAILKSVTGVDEVVIFNEDTPLDLIRSLKPEVLVKGGDYTKEQVVGKDFAGMVEIVPLTYSRSTSKLIDQYGT